MTAESGVTPGEHDLIAVEQRLSVLWADLSPAQQMVLDTIIGASLTVADTGDTSGFSMMAANPEMMRAHIQERTAELRGEWRQVAARDGAATVRARWDLRPMLDLLGPRPTPARLSRSERGVTA